MLNLLNKSKNDLHFNHNKERLFLAFNIPEARHEELMRQVLPIIKSFQGKKTQILAKCLEFSQNLMEQLYIAFLIGGRSEEERAMHKAVEMAARMTQDVLGGILDEHQVKVSIGKDMENDEAEARLKAGGKVKN